MAFDNIFYAFRDAGSGFYIVHGVKMNAPHIIGDQVDDLIDRIGDPGVFERLRVVGIFVDHGAERPRQACAAHGNGAFDL